jgi:uncharacterized protein YodC (DUF2158 family)
LKEPIVYASWFSGAKIELAAFKPESLLSIDIGKRQKTTFKPGDVVKLMSGGPKMTVSGINVVRSYAPIADDWNGKWLKIPGEIETSWFSGAKAQSSAFRPTMLMHSEMELQNRALENCTVEQVAYWMLNEIHRRGVLSQEVAAFEIASNFGQAFTYVNNNGNLAIQDSVLKIFRKLTEHAVVWEQEERYWRKRHEYDGASRAQK